MKAVRLHAYHQAPQLDEVPEPTITNPHDVILRVAGAGLCRTDIHIRDGWFAPAVPVDLPLTLGHENTGWVREVGSAVENVAVGDAVICHPQQSCGLCPACRIGDDMRCAAGLAFSGLNRPGGFAELLKTSDRAVLKLPSGQEPSTSPRTPTRASPLCTWCARRCRCSGRGRGSSWSGSAGWATSTC